MGANGVNVYLSLNCHSTVRVSLYVLDLYEIGDVQNIWGYHRRGVLLHQYITKLSLFC